jgi:CRP-like cAMP-binding protein
MPLLIATVGLRTGLVVIGVGVTAIVLVAIPGLVRVDKTALAPDGLDLLRGVPMLAVLPERIIERLARMSAIVEFTAGSTVFSEGDEGDRFYIIEHGDVDVTYDGQVLRDLTVGDSFGEIALIRDIPRTATIVATTDVVLRAIERRHFLPAVTGNASSLEHAEAIVGRLTPST